VPVRSLMATPIRFSPISSPTTRMRDSILAV
jgi:hypothetical protein